MSTDIPEKVRALVRARSGGVCEVCGMRAATQMHHRLHRSQGVLHTPSNLLDVCGSGNHSGDHGRAHTEEGFDNGWSVRSGDDPRQTAVVHALFGRVLLTDEGGWEPVSDPGVDEYTDGWVLPISGATEVADGSGIW